MVIPVGIAATTTGMELTFTEQLDAKGVQDISSYGVKTWDLIRSRKYGSKHYNEQTLQVTKAELDASGKTINLTIPAIQPTWGMEITYKVKDRHGIEREGLVQNTIHQLGSKTP